MRPTEATIAAWTRLMRAQHTVLSAIERALKAKTMPPLAWYDVLLELEGAPEGLRPFELEPRLLLPQYSLSRLIDRMVEADLVKRRPSADDKRGHTLLITPAGRRKRQEMWPIYAQAIQRAVGDRIDEQQGSMLAALLERLIDRPGEEPSGSARPSGSAKS